MTRENSQIKDLRKENDDLKSQIGNLHKELKEIREKIDKSQSRDDRELRKSVNFVSDEYDEMKISFSQMKDDLKRIDRNLSSISKKVYDIDESIEAILAYSYQYNLKIVGIPKGRDAETMEETTKICLKLFKEMGANVEDHDIDISHRLQSRKKTDPAPIVCKFTRRIAKESVMNVRKQIQHVDLSKVVNNISPELSTRPAVFEHLTPKKQELLKLSKDFQRRYEYSYCWVKNREILLRESSDSKIFKIRNVADLEKLKTPDDESFPSLASPNLVGNGRGRGYQAPSTRSSTRTRLGAS